MIFLPFILLEMGKINPVRNMIQAELHTQERNLLSFHFEVKWLFKAIW